MDKMLVSSILVCLIVGTGLGYVLGHTAFPPQSPPASDAPEFADLYIHAQGRVNCTATYGSLLEGEKNISTMVRIEALPNTHINVARPSNYTEGSWAIIVEVKMTPADGEILVPGDQLDIGVTINGNSQVAGANVVYPSTDVRLICHIGNF